MKMFFFSIWKKFNEMQGKLICEERNHLMDCQGNNKIKQEKKRVVKEGKMKVRINTKEVRITIQEMHKPGALALLLSIGLLSIGLLSIGLLSIGLLSIGLLNI